MKFFFQKHIFNFLNKLINDTSLKYHYVTDLFYRFLSVYIAVLKESLLFDYIQKMYLIKLLMVWLTAIAVYFENSGLNRIITKIWNLFGVDVTNKIYGNIWLNFFLQTFIIYFFVNVCVLIYIFY